MSDAASTSDAEAPVAADERIAALDVLRGFALLGIFIMNMPGFSHSLFAPPTPPVDALDGWTAAARDLFFAGKFNLLFGALFGAGFALQMRRLAEAERARASRLGAPERRHRAFVVVVRRLAFLLVVGLAHASLLWPGDVLLVYAVLGFAMLALRHARDRTLLAIVAACLVFPAASEALARTTLSSTFETMAAFAYQELQASNDAAFGRGTFADAVRETAHVFAWSTRSSLGLYAYLGFAVQMATGILAGFVVARRGWLERVARVGVPTRWLVGAAAAAIVGNAIAALRAGALVPVLGDPGAIFVVALARTLGRAALSACYALAVVRLAGTGPLPRWLHPLRQAGRMPLTQYLLQTLLGTFCFYGWGLGWWNRAGATFETALAVALFLWVQLPLAVVWLARWRAGPLETLWRWFTYGSLPRR